MRVRDLVREPKTVVDPGGWHQGKIASTAFPLSRSPIKLGSAWRWRVVRLVGSRPYRLLIAYRWDKPNFWAWMAEELPKGLAVVCCMEDHLRPHEMGVHVHAPCGDDPEIPLGAQRYPDMIRLPAFGGRHRPRWDGALTDMTVMPLAFDFFGVTSAPGDLI